MPRFVFAGAVGAALAYFFDPDNGRKRRKEAIKKAAKGLGQAGRKAQAVRTRAQPDDPTLADRVKGEIFRDADVAKEQVDVSVEDGVVYLRGELEEPDLIEDLEAQARQVQGVRGVENLLHASGKNS
jgi:osmotically-inducible protein OsmY